MIKQRKIELLAPAKNLECGIEAINHGADAVYIGAPKFGARAAAVNSLEDIEALDRQVEVRRRQIIAADGAANYVRPFLNALTEEEFDAFLQYHLAPVKRMDLMGASGHTVDILVKRSLETYEKWILPILMAGFLLTGCSSPAATSSALPSSTEKITETQMNKDQITNPLEAIRGRVPGLTIQRGTNGPAALDAVRLRGTTSLTSGNDPLITSMESSAI